MNLSDIVPDDAKEEFWAVVTDCLHAFHGRTLAASRREVKQERGVVDSLPMDEAMYFYHREPYDIACRITGRQIDVEEHRDRYLHIRDVKHGTGIAEQGKPRRRKSTLKE